MNKTEQLTKTITDLQQALEKAQKELEEAKKEKVWPQEGDVYYYIEDTGVIYITYWNPLDNYSLDREKMNNIFRTEEEAEHYRDWLKNPIVQSRYKLQKYADECNKGWVYKGNGEKGYYHYIECKIIGVSYYTNTYKPVIIFKRQEDALKAIEVLGEDVIKLACGITE